MRGTEMHPGTGIDHPSFVASADCLINPPPRTASRCRLIHYIQTTADLLIIITIVTRGHLSFDPQQVEDGLLPQIYAADNGRLTG